MTTLHVSTPAALTPGMDHARPVRSDLAVLKDLVARAFGVAPHLMDAPTRCKLPVANARQCAMYLANVALGMPFAHVGIAFGRDRTTASHAAQVTEDRRDDPAFDALVTRIELELAAHTAAREVTDGEA